MQQQTKHLLVSKFLLIFLIYLNSIKLDNDLITVASIKSYLEIRKKSHRETQQSAALTSKNGHQNGHDTDAFNLDSLSQLEV